MATLKQAILEHPGGRYCILLVIGLVYGLVLPRTLAVRPWWAYFTLAVVALVPLALFLNNRRMVHLFGLIVIATLMGGVYLADAMQESASEQVIRISNELTQAVSKADYATIEKHLASDYKWHNLNKAGMMNRVKTSLLPSESRSCSISSAKVREPEGSPTLTVEGNLSASGRYGSEEGFFTGTIELKYQQQSDGSYKLVGTRVAWFNGNEVSIPSR